ncbi:MAG: hypothetical protein NT076_03450 [Candidatus Pacearchaeota archaeon]|nr:hypothetical protein [Candidatus Pacearchaeota archaeon]
MAEGMKKFTGLMFKKPDTNALLFEELGSIHSFFCPDFLAIWLDDENKIVDYKLITSGKPNIKPDKPFAKLLEVPLNEKYSEVTKFFLDQKRE